MAIVTPGSLASPMANAGDFADKIIAKFSLLGITDIVSSYEESAGSLAYRVARIVLNSKSKGTVYWQLLVEERDSDFLISQQMVTDWDDASRSFDLETTSLANRTTFPKGRLFRFFAINSEEIRCLLLFHSRYSYVNRIYLGYIRPANIPPSWWDENSYPYCFVSTNGFFNSFEVFKREGSPFNTTSDFLIPPSTSIASRRSLALNKISIWAGVPFISYSTYGVVQIFNQEVVYFAQNTYIKLGYYLRDKEKSLTYFVFADETSIKLAIRVD